MIGVNTGTRVLTIIGIFELQRVSSDILDAVAKMDRLVRNNRTGDRDEESSIAMPASLQPSPFSNFFTMISSYGCWCYLNAMDYGRARGPVQDEVDQECQKLEFGYRCAVLDAEARGEECLAYSQSYTQHNPFLAMQGLGVQAQCETGNPGNHCAQQACMIEGYFLQNFFSYFFVPGGVAYDDTLRHETGFDATDMCSSDKPAQDRGQTECCGAIPDRFPYRNLHGTRQCCDGSVFNTSILKSCVTADGSCRTMSIGDDCG